MTAAQLQRLLEVRDEIALLDPSEDPDGIAGMAASNVIALHNEFVTGGDGGDTAA